MKIAIRGHDFGKKGEFDLTEKLVQAGFDGVQLVPYKTYSDIPQSPEISTERATEIAQSLSKAGKEVVMLGAYFNPVHSVKEKVENGINTFKRYIELASVFGAPVVGSETGSFNDDKWTYNPLNRTDEALQTVIETFRELCIYAQKFNVCVGIEGAAGHVCFRPERLKEAVDAIGQDNLKVIFDIYNYLDDSNYDDYINIMEKGLEIFDKKVHCFHMKDCRIENGALKQCPIGQGMFDYEKILKIIKNHNPNAILILEGTTGENILPSLQFIKEIWSRI